MPARHMTLSQLISKLQYFEELGMGRRPVVLGQPDEHPTDVVDVAEQIVEFQSDYFDKLRNRRAICLHHGNRVRY